MREHLATLLNDFRKNKHETAIVRYQGVRRRVTTYGALATMAGRFAAFLEDRGIGMGDRVLLWGENSAEWVAAFYGCMLRGVIAVPLDAFGSAEFAARVAADVKPKLAVGDAQFARVRIAGIRDHRLRDRTASSVAFEDWRCFPSHARGRSDSRTLVRDAIADSVYFGDNRRSQGYRPHARQRARERWAD